MGYRFLVVDDSATTRAIIKRTIQMADIPVDALHEAPDGRKALGIALLNPLDLVFADINMPEMNGIELTRALRANAKTAHLPVVVVSSESMEKRIEELQTQGVRGYIKKPFTPEQIRAVIVDILQVPNAA